MDTHSFVFGVAVGVVATVLGGVILATILGIWRTFWRYMASIFNDMRISSSAAKEGKIQEANIHDKHAFWKMMGCLGAFLLLGVLLNVAAVILAVVAAAINPTH